MTEVCRQLDSAGEAATPIQNALPFVLFDSHKHVFKELKALLDHAMEAVDTAEQIRSCAEEHVSNYIG